MADQLRFQEAPRRSHSDAKVVLVDLTSSPARAAASIQLARLRTVERPPSAGIMEVQAIFGMVASQVFLAHLHIHKYL